MIGEQLALDAHPPDPSRPSTNATTLRELAERIPVPVDAFGQRCHAYVGSAEAADGTRAWRVYWARDGGRLREYVGPLFPLSRAGARNAIRFAVMLG